MTIQAEQITIDRNAAVAALRKYREHRYYSQPIDAEIARIYAAIAKGQVVIQALRSIAQSGLGEDGLPRLAIVRADSAKVWLTLRADGGCRFAMRQYQHEREHRQYLDLPAGSFPGARPRRDLAALAPLVPLDVRPRRGLENYHVLFEPVWAAEPPLDPLLLRRLGQADMWTVLAQWDTGPIEREVLRSRLRPR